MTTPEKTKNTDYSISNDVLSPQKILFERLANKWFLLLLFDLSIEPRRFNKLLKSHNGLSQKMLSQTLKNLEEDGLLSREVNGNRMPVEVTYSITPFGISLLDIVKPLFGWSNNNVIQVLKNRKKYAKKYNAIDK